MKTKWFNEDALVTASMHLYPVVLVKMTEKKVVFKPEHKNAPFNKGDIIAIDIKDMHRMKVDVVKIGKYVTATLPKSTLNLLSVSEVTEKIKFDSFSDKVKNSFGIGLLMRMKRWI